MKDRKYTVEWKIYQYNSGRADNCTFTASKDFDYKNDALEFKKTLIQAREAMEAGDEKSFYYKWGMDLIFEWTPAGGYIKRDEPVGKKIVTETTIIE